MPDIEDIADIKLYSERIFSYCDERGPIYCCRIQHTFTTGNTNVMHELLQFPIRLDSLLDNLQLSHEYVTVSLMH